MTQEKPSIKDSVFSAIESGKAVMRPRWHFVLRTILAVIGIVFLFIFALYLVNLAIFLLNDSGLIFVPMFGMIGILEFLVSAPWMLLVGALIFIAVLELLVRKFSFGYRKPLLYSIVGIVAIVALGSGMVYTIVPSEILERIAEQGGYLEHGRQLRGPGFPPPANVHPGMISKMTRDGFVLENRAGESYVVTITSETRFPDGTDLADGDRVVVLGSVTGTDTIDAMGVRRIDQVRPPQHMRGWWHFDLDDASSTPTPMMQPMMP